MMPQEAAFPEPGHRPEINPVAGRIEPAPRTPTCSRLPCPQVRQPAICSVPCRRWMTAIALGGTLAGITAIAVWYLMTPEYTAYAQIRVSAVTPHVVDWGGDKNEGQVPFMTYLASQATQYKSHQVIQAALNATT